MQGQSKPYAERIEETVREAVANGIDTDGVKAMVDIAWQKMTNETAAKLYGACDADEDAECEGHPAGPGDPMGETVYCDDSCKRVSLVRGRVKNADLAPGERYFAVYTATGVCCFKTRSEDEAREIVARNPDKLSYTEHTK